MENLKLAKAKTALIIDQPFFATILLSMPMTENKSIPTMATNGESIIYNPDFVESMTVKELTFVLAHETLHCVFHHMTRRGDRNPNRWNIAADYIINDVLVADRVGDMPKIGLYDPAIVAKGKGTTNGVYDLLGQDQEDKSKHGPGKPGGALDQVMDADQGLGDGQDQGQDGHGPGKVATNGTSGDVKSLKERESEMIAKIIQARNAAKMLGKLSGKLEKLVGELIKPKVDWRDVLRRFISTRAKNELSYSRPKRRFLADDLCLPSLTGEKLGKIVIAVDCSGSISKKEIDAFCAEINAIKTDTMPESIDVIYFDDSVLAVESYGPDDDISLKKTGGGGTAFSPIFESINQESELPIACIVLTDLCCNDFGPSPDYPVLWVSTDNGKAPFGEIVLMKGKG